MTALSTKTIWIIAGCLFIVAGLTGGNIPMYGAAAPALVWVPVYAVAIAVLLLAWGGPNRRSIVQSSSGWIAVVAFLAIPFVHRLIISQFAAANRPAYDVVATSTAIGVAAAALTGIAAFVLVQHAIRSGLVPASLQGVLYVILGVWIASNLVVYVPITDMVILPVVLDIVGVIRMLVPAAIGIVLLLCVQKITDPGVDPVASSPSTNRPAN